MALTEEQVKIIKSTVPVLQEHGTTVTTAFYKNILSENPELNSVFNTTNQLNGHQQKALAGAVYAYAVHIDNLGVLAPAVENIVHKHASLHIQPEHYKVVGTYLLAAMKEVLGDALTPEIHDAWAAAYFQLADIFIAKEGALYKETEGWADWRDFIIDKKVSESEEITSFYLKPVDGKSLPEFQPGQYISVRVEVPELKHLQPRQYSLSDKYSPEYYRISVKKETGLDPKHPETKYNPGWISNILHDVKKEGDVIQVSHPHGVFYLADAKSSSYPVVLIAAGVGLTPLTSMLNTIAASETASSRKVHFIHSARKAKSRAFKEHLLSLSKQFPNLQVTLFNTAPSSEEKEGDDYNVKGPIDLGALDKNEKLFLDDSSTQYFVCGPEGFMTTTTQSLIGLGVTPDRIHMELFGTGGIPSA
ncbi:flavohemo protein [Talaromyces proteolyticus]|uniref:nitric oxide dioxygenase n=1 Tax=Talaromyces proteolyticus TaxID=1131652 RepID=A0AAD4Q4X0_9EURO|nr:flavohemo protein [Talaromyces proteolyticus]KAH8703445.1 flavohemo protein [Talaromyces proteolyticus]